MTDFVSMTSVDGNITPTEEASIPVMDRGFLYGDSIYEVFRTYDGVPLLFEEHWARFCNSARLIHLELQFSPEAVAAEIRRTVAATNAPAIGQDVYVRYVVTRGVGSLGLLPDAAQSQRLVVVVLAVPKWKAQFYSHGVSLAVVATRRNETQTLDPNIKGGNYLNNVLGAIEAGRLGADDALMLDSSNYLTEATNSNVFIVRDGVALTPSQISANLKGTTKQTVFGLCEQAGLELRESELTVDDLRGAQECFLTSATREIMPVASVVADGRDTVEFPAGGGPITRQLAQAYKGFVADHVARYGRYSMFAPQ